MKVRLREMRTAQGWTQDVAAARLGISKSHVSEIENGKKNPSSPLLDRMAKVFGLNVPDLIEPDPGSDPSELTELIASFLGMEAEDRAAILQLARKKAQPAS